MAEVNWNTFKAKFEGKERLVFERLSYQLFCNEFERRAGIFRFKNQTGIETEPIQISGECIGFQAKYFEGTIATNKEDIIDSIQKAKGKNPNLNKILFYLNLEFSESSKLETKDPQYKIDIEKAAADLNLTINWRVPSHFERQLVLPENQHLLQYFFSLGKNAIDFLNELKEHTENILIPIHSEIVFATKQIKIDRSSSMKAIRESNTGSSIFLVYGEGGSGKTGLIKDFYAEAKTNSPFYIFKAAEFNLLGLSEFFNQYGQYTFQDFIQLHGDQKDKYVVIDSAEKLSDLENLDMFKELLAGLIKAQWTIIFTTRFSYLDDLRFQLTEIYRVNYSEVHIKNLSYDELEQLAELHDFELPSNERLLKLLGNPFYLNEYLLHYRGLDNSIDLKKFKNILWQAKVQQSIKRDNIHVQRENTFLKLVKEKCDTGLFFLKTQTEQSSILSKLSEDEIIKYDTATGGYFIAHDIYEEWALERIIEREYRTNADYKVFLNNIGTSLPIRRAFRNWLSESLIESFDDIKPFVEYAIFQEGLQGFWKDEILIAVLLSDYAQQFFDLFKSELLKENKRFLKRIIFLLKIAGKEIDTKYYSYTPTKEFDYIMTRPKGRGWDCVITFLNSNKEKFVHEDYEYIVPFLLEWVSNNYTGVTTRNACLFVLDPYQRSEIEKTDRFDSSIKESIETIIFQGAAEIKSELETIFSQIVQNKWKGSSDPFADLCEAALTRTYYNIQLIIALPESIISVAHLKWFKEKEPKKKSQFGFEFEEDSIEHHYAIREGVRRDYFPASALQSPILWLLRFAMKSTIDFILDFTNKTVANYSNSPMNSRIDGVHQIDVFVGDGVANKQFISNSIWCMYRGTGSPVTPYLLQTIHMALEKFLLEEARKNPGKLEPLLLYLIKKTKSASITAVVTSIVLAFPDALFNVAQILFQTSELFFYDNIRASNEHQAKSLYSIGYGMNPDDKKFEDERIETVENPHRKKSLESQIVLYQKFRSADISEEESQRRQTLIWETLDKFYSNLPPESKQTDADRTLRLLLTRIDGRKLKVKVEDTKEGIQISFDTEVDPELKKYSEDATKGSARFFKYMPLNLWGNKKNDKSVAGDYEQYENNPLLVLSETKALIEELKSGNVRDYSFDYATPAFTCAALIKHYADSLSAEDLSFCKDIILEFSSRPLRPDYDYQISDGVEAAVSALPFLFKLFPDDRPGIKTILLFILFDTHRLGEYKSISDYAVEAIVNGLWNEFPVEAQSLFFGFILLEPKFYAYLKKSIPQGHHYHDANSRIKVLEEFTELQNDTLEAMAANKLVFQIPDGLRVGSIFSAFLLIPSTTTDKDHIRYVNWLIPHFSEALLDNKDKFDFKIKFRFLKQFALFVLRRNVEDIDSFIKPWLPKLSGSDSFQHFLNEFVTIEDIVYSYEQFWVVWELLYPTVLEFCKRMNDYRIREVVSNYLLAWPYWKKGIKEWRSLKDREKVFFKRAAHEMGFHPAALYSISKFLNEIGSGFSKEGLIWVSDMLKANPTLSSIELERNTVYYLEVFIRKFVYVHRTKIKTDLYFKKNVITLINFLVERGSVQAYLLREEVV